MSTFSLAISCLTTSNLPWFMDLGSYAILLFTALDLASITSHIHNWVSFCFGPVSSFFLELFLHWSPVAYWVLTNLGSSSFSVISFCLFMLFMGFSRQEYQSGLQFLSPVDHVLSDTPFFSPGMLTFKPWAAILRVSLIWTCHFFRDSVERLLKWKEILEELQCSCPSWQVSISSP